MSSIEKELDIAIKAKYYTQGEGRSDTKRVWIACHGYGELAVYFIKKFEMLDAKTDFVIAPQGLSLFYLEGFSGRVGANWMTSHDRNLAMRNYVSYIDAVCKRELAAAEIDIKKIEIYGFGFSQGTATICRWAATTALPISKLILWAGIVPPDMNAIFFDGLKQSEVHLIYGKQDTLVSPVAVENQQLSLHKKGIRPEVHSYEGGHRIDVNWFEKWIKSKIA
ncbi:MAG: alpha/beta hydrolase [Bernardetiaceae bacterium]|nr:alpha/beta hydrolase [Bernardetiaceae bacterium]